MRGVNSQPYNCRICTDVGQTPVKEVKTAFAWANVGEPRKWCVLYCRWKFPRLKKKKLFKSLKYSFHIKKRKKWEKLRTASTFERFGLDVRVHWLLRKISCHLKNIHFKRAVHLAWNYHRKNKWGKLRKRGIGSPIPISPIFEYISS